MSAETTYQIKRRITTVIPLEDQISMINHRLDELVQLGNFQPKCQERINLKINFWSNVLRQLETLKSQSK